MIKRGVTRTIVILHEEKNLLCTIYSLYGKNNTRRYNPSDGFSQESHVEKNNCLSEKRWFCFLLIGERKDSSNVQVESEKELRTSAIGGPR